jgi:Fe-S oxidoreductase
MFEQPREVLRATGKIIPVKNEKLKAHCCGGSLGNLKISQQERAILRDQAVNDFLQYQPDVLATACPMCKKTFARDRRIKVMDIAEIVVNSIPKPKIPEPAEEKIPEEYPEEALVVFF